MIHSKERYFVHTNIKARTKYLRTQTVYNALSEIIVAVFFLLGSLLYLTDTHIVIGSWLFVIGSAQLLVKPIITLVNGRY